jgi:hypothetical protein
MYQLTGSASALVTPAPIKRNNRAMSKRKAVLEKGIRVKDVSVSQKRVDDILDKIHQKGMHTLTQEEKDILQRAGSEDHK